MFTLRLTTICLHFDSLFYFDILFFFYHTKMFTIWLTTIFIHCDRIFYFNILFLFDIFPCSSFTTKYLQCLVTRLSDSHCFSFNYIISTSKCLHYGWLPYVYILIVLVLKRYSSVFRRADEWLGSSKPFVCVAFGFGKVEQCVRWEWHGGFGGLMTPRFSPRGYA